MGTKKRGGSYARSEAELEQIVDGLYEQEVSIASFVSSHPSSTIKFMCKKNIHMSIVVKTSFVMDK